MISEKVRALSDNDLRSMAEKIAAHNRRVEAIFIEHLAEIERRKVFCDWGFSSMYDYLTRELRYSGSSAYRRIEAARALAQIPEIKNEIESGALNLSQICNVQTAVKREQRENVKMKVTVEEKKELFHKFATKLVVKLKRSLIKNLSRLCLWSPLKHTKGMIQSS